MRPEMRLYRHFRRGGEFTYDVDTTGALGVGQEMFSDIVAYVTTEAVPLDISNVADYAHRIGRVALRSIIRHDVPLIAPWPVTWVEFTHDADSYGLCIMQDGGRRDSLGTQRMFPFMWLFGKPRPMGPLAEVRLWLDEEGCAKLNHEGQQTIQAYPFTAGLRDNAQNAKDALWQVLNIAQLGFAFCHCKNVAISDVYPTRQERRTAERSGLPAVIYRTLAIDPNRTQTIAPHHDPQGKRETRLHICRGHFATYRDDAPLFGKYVGTFWIPAHVRGSSDVGEVKKDYVVTGTRALPVER